MVARSKKQRLNWNDLLQNRDRRGRMEDRPADPFSFATV